MPVWIIRSCKDIIVHSIVRKDLCPCCHHCFFWICQMYNYFNIRIYFSNSLCTCLKKLTHSPFFPYTNKTIGCFVSYLYHINSYTSLHNLIQCIFCKCIHSFCFLLQSAVFPFLWGLLFGWVCPKIRIMKIY